MITPDDIEAFADDVAIGDRCIERSKNGVVEGRRIHANEELPVLRALYLWRSAAFGALEALNEKALESIRMDGEG